MKAIEKHWKLKEPKDHRSVKGKTGLWIRLGLVGWYPPPIGGISVHVKRLRKELDFLGVNDIVYDIGAKSAKETGVIPESVFRLWMLISLFSPSFDRNIVHIHLTSWKQRALALLFKFRVPKIMYTFHSLREEVKELSLLNRLCMRLVLLFGDHFIAVSNEIQQKLIQRGVNQNKINVIPAFIPPQVSLEDNKLPNAVLQFISNHSPILTANASRIGFF